MCVAAERRLVTPSHSRVWEQVWECGMFLYNTFLVAENSQVVKFCMRFTSNNVQKLAIL